LKKLNQVVFPVTYNDKFYKDVLEVGELAKLSKFTVECSVNSVYVVTASLHKMSHSLCVYQSK